MFALRRWSVRHAAGMYRLYALAERAAVYARPLFARLPEGLTGKLIRPVEKLAKTALFDCKMCGQCALSRTGMACPMNCPKQLRNGPCGGVKQDGGCEVTPDMPCVWVEALEGKARIGAAMADVRLLPVDRRNENASTWVQVLRDRVPPAAETAITATRAATAPNPFRDACVSERPVVTVELGPPDSADASDFLAKAEMFRGVADGINITDGAGGNCHMSSVAAAALLVRAGLHPVAQVTCRDRNRIAIQGDVLGANALGATSFLCLTGDDTTAGDQPDAKRVFDLDAVNLVKTLARMRDDGEFASGRKLNAPLDIFIGATCNPFAPPFADRLDNLERKIDAGAQFIQTQFCFDVPLMERFMNKVVKRGLHKRAKIIAGSGILPSARGLTFMARRVPGVRVPDALIARIGAAADQRAEAVNAASEIIRQIATFEGVGGFHLMGHRNEKMLLDIIKGASIARNADTGTKRECA